MRGLRPRYEPGTGGVPRVMSCNVGLQGDSRCGRGKVRPRGFHATRRKFGASNETWRSARSRSHSSRARRPGPAYGVLDSWPGKLRRITVAVHVHWTIMPAPRRLPPWAMALAVAAIPVGTYAWMLYSRPNIYEQIAEEIKRQEAQETGRPRAI